MAGFSVHGLAQGGRSVESHLLSKVQLGFASGRPGSSLRRLCPTHQKWLRIEHAVVSSFNSKHLLAVADSTSKGVLLEHGVCLVVDATNPLVVLHPRTLLLVHHLDLHLLLLLHLVEGVLLRRRHCFGALWSHSTT